MIDPEYKYWRKHAKDAKIRYRKGITAVCCDIPGCLSRLEINGVNGRCLPYAEIITEMKRLGWHCRRIERHWMDLCINCSKTY